MREFIKSERGKVLYIIITILAIVVFSIILIPPLFQLINKLDPVIIGLSLFAFMELLLGLILAVLLVSLFWIQSIRGEL